MAASGSLTAKQRLLIVTLLSEGKIDSAAEKAHVSPRCAYRWLKMPAFAHALEKARVAQCDDALALLRSSIGSAVRKARELLDSDKPSVALKACNTLLTHALTVRREQGMPLEKVMGLQSLMLDLVFSAMRDLGLPETALRMRMAATFGELLKKGYPIVSVDLNDVDGGSNGQHTN